MARRGQAGQGVARPGEARIAAWRGLARPGEARIEGAKGAERKVDMDAVQLLRWYGIRPVEVEETLSLYLCPFHLEFSPSMLVNRTRDHFYCFTCHTHGGMAELKNLLKDRNPASA